MFQFNVFAKSVIFNVNMFQFFYCCLKICILKNIHEYLQIFINNCGYSRNARVGMGWVHEEFSSNGVGNEDY